MTTSHAITAIAIRDAPVPTTSLRRRVTIAVLAVLLTVLVLLAVTVNWLLSSRLRAAQTQRLSDRAAYAQLLATSHLPAQTLVNRLTGQGITAQLAAAAGPTVYGQDVPADPTSSGPAKPAGKHHPPSGATAIAIARTGTTLTAALDVPGGRLTLQASDVDVARTLDLLRRIEAGAGVATLLLTGLLLTRLVGAALAPLDRMTLLARHIRDGARGRRLHPTRPSTDLGRTAAAFDDMLDALETAETHAHAAEARMSRFLADASHDLRTPLAGVTARAEHLLRADPDRIDREHRLVELIRDARRAARLVDDLLLITRLDAHDEPATTASRHPGVIDLAAVAALDVEALRIRRPDLTIDVAPADAPPAAVLGNADQLHRAVGNLLDNAARHTPPAGRIHIALNRDHTDWRLHITDSGPGVPADDVERIFDRFVRLNTARTGPGTGLGLPIARAIARAHGGDVTCTPPVNPHHATTNSSDAPPAGAHFTLTWPATPSTENAHPHPYTANNQQPPAPVTVDTAPLRSPQHPAKQQPHPRRRSAPA